MICTCNLMLSTMSILQLYFSLLSLKTPIMNKGKNSNLPEVASCRHLKAYPLRSNRFFLCSPSHHPQSNPSLPSTVKKKKKQPQKILLAIEIKGKHK